MADKGMPEIRLFQIHQDGFTFLGKENVLTETPDFGQIWEDFFTLGGYDPIRPFAADPVVTNVWYTNEAGQRIYSQGFIAGEVTSAPAGYSATTFPASDFLVVTTDWMPTSEQAVGDDGNGRCNRFAETVEAPPGYVRNDGPNAPITAIERENADTPEGSRYEVWVPIKRVGQRATANAG